MTSELAIAGCEIVEAKGELRLALRLRAAGGAEPSGGAVIGRDAVDCDLLAREAKALAGRSAFARHPWIAQENPLVLDQERRAIVGSLELARLDALARAHGMPLHRWLGGPLRRNIAVATALGPSARQAIALPLAAIDASRRVVLGASEKKLPRLIETLTALRKTLQPDTELALQLEGQLEARDIEALLAAGRELNLAYIADPLRGAAETCAIFARSTPPLALTAHRYPMAELLRLIAAGGGPLMLLVDPVALGGLEAARALGTLAEMTGIQMSLLGSGGMWKACLAAHLTAVLAACTGPVIADGATLAALGAREGLVALGESPGIDWTGATRPKRAVRAAVAGS